jgi:eukaryotic-like serine/threonine-protein kinase
MSLMDPGRRTLAGRYRLESVLGRGGMSIVYGATDLVLERTVAVKVLHSELADEDSTYVARFQREAQAAAALANSSVVTIYDTGVDEGARFIVMECVAGRSLAAILADEKPLSVDEAVRIAVRVASALATAHAAGILHRDIKPANVMIADDGAVKVLDFGIARKLDGTTLTQVASVIGTAAYMPPERALGEAGDARADVYSLGCLLYAMLTGGPPFRGEVAAVILHQQINAEPRAPSELRERIPASLDRLVLAMLAKAPEGRPQAAAEVRDRLAALSGPRSRRAPTAVAAVAPAEAPAPTLRLEHTAATRVFTAPARWDHRRRAIVMAIATGVLALTAIAIGSSGGSSSHHAATGSSPHQTTTAATGAATTAPPTATRAATQTPSPNPAPPAPAAGPPGQGPGGPPGHQGKKPHGQGGGDGGD